MTSSAKGDADHLVLPRGSWTDRMCPLPIKPNGDWQTG